MGFFDATKSKPAVSIDTLKSWNEAYRSGNPIVSDSEYDKHHHDLRTKFPNDTFFLKPEPEPLLNSRGEITHEVPMLSTEKAYTSEELASFIKRCQSEVEGEAVFRITPKLDGVAVRLYNPTTLATRGDGDKGTDISFLIGLGVTIQGSPTYPCNGELVIPKQYFEENLSEKFKYPRNVMAGLCSVVDLQSHHKQMIESEAAVLALYDSLDCIKCSGQELQQNIETYFEALTSKCAYHTDGIIIELAPEHAESRERLGATEHHYRWMLAYKKAGETAISQVLSITWQVGRLGKVTPVLEIQPVQLTGATISRVTGHNWKYLVDNDISKESSIELVRSGDVIPKHIKTISSSNPVHVISQCPCCRSELEIEGPNLFCRNLKCADQKLQKLVYFFQTLGNNENFGEGTLQKILSSYPDLQIHDLYQQGTKEFFQKLGFGEKTSENLVQALSDSVTHEIEDWRYLAAFSIEGLGSGDSKKLLKKWSIEDLLVKVLPKDIEAVDGFAAIKAEKICRGLAERGHEINTLRISFFKNLKPSKAVATVQSVFTGKRVVFTGAFKSGKRDFMHQHCESQGAIIQLSVSRKTDFLVFGESLGAAKRESAEKLGTQVISEDQYLEMCRGAERYD